MKITEEMVKSWITDGVASSMDAAKGDARKIAAQMTAEIATNKSGTSSNTIRMPVTIKIDKEKRQVEITGSYGFTIPNLGDEAPKLVRDIPNPDQGELPGIGGKPIDATTPNPDEE